jgi:hypothetical protein
METLTSQELVNVPLTECFKSNREAFDRSVRKHIGARIGMDIVSRLPAAYAVLPIPTVHGLHFDELHRVQVVVGTIEDYVKTLAAARSEHYQMGRVQGRKDVLELLRTTMRERADVFTDRIVSAVDAL